MRKIICIVTACFLLMSIFSGCAVLQKLGLQKDNDELRPVSSIVMNEDEAKKLSDKVPIHLYFANQDSSKLKLEVRYIPVTEAKKSINNLATVVVKELIKGPAAGAGLKATIPAGAELRAPVSIKAGVATVDFTKSFVDKHPGGKTAEQLTIFSIVNSLTELKEIQKVKFTINGKTQKEYKGSLQFDIPFPRSASLISKEASLPETGAGSDKTDSKESSKQKDTNTKDPAKKTPAEPKKDDAKSSPTKDSPVKDNAKQPANSQDDQGVQTNQDSGDAGDDSQGVYLEEEDLLE